MLGRGRSKKRRLVDDHKMIWAISLEECHECSVLSVYSSRELAEKALEPLLAASNSPGYQPYLEALPLDWQPQYDPRTDKVWLVWMKRDGVCTKVEQMGDEDAMFAITDTPSVRYPEDRPSVLSCFVLAKDAQHAVKIMNESRTKLIANSKWEG